MHPMRGNSERHSSWAAQAEGNIVSGMDKDPAPSGRAQEAPAAQRQGHTPVPEWAGHAGQHVPQEIPRASKKVLGKVAISC